MRTRQEQEPEDRLRQLVAEVQELAERCGYGSLVQLVKDGVVERPDVLSQLPRIWQEDAEVAIFCRDAHGGCGTYRLTAGEEDLSWGCGVGGVRR